jgi:hypothetical protein
VISREANVIVARLALRNLLAHRIEAHVEESDPAYEDLGSGKCNHRKRRPLEGDQPVDPECDPPEDE